MSDKLGNPEGNGNDEENLIEIPEAENDEGVEQSSEGLSEQEIVLAKKHGLIKDEEKEESEDGVQDKKQEEVKPKDVKEVLEPESFEKMDEVFDKDQTSFHTKFKPNEKALYFKFKKEKMQRQEAVRQLEELRAEKELGSVKDGSYKAKLAKAREALKDPDLTVEKLNAILGDAEAEQVEEKKEITGSKEAEVIKQKAYRERVQLAENIGRSKHEHFDKYADLAQEMAKEDPAYLDILTKAFQGLYNNDSTVDEDKIVDRIVSIAKLSPKFKDVGSKASPEEQEKVSRAIKNSEKKASTASLGGKGTGRFKSEDDLSPEDVVNMDAKSWNKLSRKTRDRLLKEAS